MILIDFHSTQKVLLFLQFVAHLRMSNNQYLNINNKLHTYTYKFAEITNFYICDILMPLFLIYLHVNFFDIGANRN